MIALKPIVRATPTWPRIFVIVPILTFSRMFADPEACTHKLAEMPRWLSSKKMEVVKRCAHSFFFRNLGLMPDSFVALLAVFFRMTPPCWYVPCLRFSHDSAPNLERAIADL